ncbi:MAG: uracil-DNA glycosylase [Gammaproteobacteria bacterium]|nr:uracil-DNA glycosylase [Gammaproteobacteria bacterium]
MIRAAAGATQDRAAVPFDAACRACPRLAAFLDEVRVAHPDYHARPVAPFGAEAPRLLIVGLAPGMHGANRTGRPFTGDYAGVLLYQTLFDLGLGSRPDALARDDGLVLVDCRITNAVKCLPPANKPEPKEIARCNGFLAAELAATPSVRAILALGRIAHDATLKALGLKPAAHAFAHGATHALPDDRWLVDSYHCSRYNTQTRRLTGAMFAEVVAAALAKARA